VLILCLAQEEMKHGKSPSEAQSCKLLRLADEGVKQQTENRGEPKCSGISIIRKRGEKDYTEEIMENDKMNIKENIESLWEIILFGLLILSPFIIGFLLYLWLNPISCMEKVVSLLVITIICAFEAVISWGITANL